MDEGLRHGFRLGDACDVHPEERTVVADGRRTQLSELAMDFLMVLASSPGDVFEDGVLRARLELPPGRQLEECLLELQRALGDSAERPRYIRRVGDVGFQLLMHVQLDIPPVPTADEIRSN